MATAWLSIPAALWLGCGPASGAVSLAREGRATATVVLGAQPTLPERTAAEELAAYLGRVTGGAFAVVTEGEEPVGEVRVYVGPTAFAARHGLEGPALGPEEWVARTVGDDLILMGGRPRGTLYAVYRFLEDLVGIHWWNPWEELVPSQPSLTVDPLDRRGQPAFRYRDIYMLYGEDGGRFAARNRLNRQGDAPIAKEYGGEMDYGPPYHVHTFYTYAPPAQYFAPHPEWYSLINGQRTAEQGQLCLTNAELRRFLIERLKAFIAESRAQAEREGVPPPVVFDISQNDWAGACECPQCRALAEAEGSEAGPVLDFVNAMADAIREDYPEVFLDTLAYWYTQQAPQHLRPRDNVIIRLCDTASNFTKAITDAENAPFREHLLSWAAIAGDLRIWDYAVSYAPYYGLPMPTAHTYPADYRFYAEHNVEGVFTEHEYPVLADLRDLKVWLMLKLLEDPYRDDDELVRTFTDGFYGPAGARVREYLRELEAAAQAKPSYLSMGASPRQYRYLDLAFVREAMTTFNRAERVVGDDPVLQRRVRHARLPLDRTALVLFPTLMREWMAQGHAPEEMPLDRGAIAARVKDTWYAQTALRLPAAAQAAERAAADAEVAALTARRAHVPLPERFRDAAPGTVFDYTADTTRNWQDTVKVVPDADAESGITNRLVLSDEDMQKCALPMPWGLYDQINKVSPGSSTIKPEDVPGPGYHWYRLGRFAIGPAYYLYFFWSWIIQVDIDDVVDPAHPGQEFEVWARIKFEGPGFPHGQSDTENAISVERVVLVKAPAA